MSFVYNRLWKILIDKGMNKVTLRDTAGLSTSTLARLSKNQIVSLEALGKICDVLDCNVGDVIDYVKEK